MILGLRTVVYHVGNLGEAKDWYIQMLGYPPYFDQPFYVGFNIGGYELGLDPDLSKITLGSSTTAYWGVPEIHAAYDRLLELGAKPHAAVQDVGDNILVASVTDPWGNIFGIIQNPHFKLEARENSIG